MSSDPTLSLTDVERIVRATAEGVTRGVLAACSCDEAPADEPLPGDGPQVWDGTSHIMDAAGTTQLGDLVGWAKGDQIVEVATFDNEADFEAFLTSTFKLTSYSTTSDNPIDVIRPLEAGYSSSATRRFGVLIGDDTSGLATTAIEAEWLAVTGYTISWWKVTQVIGGATKNVGFLYRAVETVTHPQRVFDQWFLCSNYSGPSGSDVTVTPITPTPTFSAARTAVVNDNPGTITWRYHRFAWHVRPTS